MSTLTSNANNNNNNNLIIATSSPAASTSSSSTSTSNAINNINNNPSTPASQNHHPHHHQSALASGVSSAKRLLPFARSMSSSSNGGGGGGGGATGGAASTSSATGGIPAELNVVLHGYHRKLKTNKKKYFVVYDDLPSKSARLEYFDSEKKFKQSWVKNSSVHAKRSIILRNCFNINKGHDPKKHVIALYTRDDCFSIVFDSEDELNRWLRTLWSLQRGEESEGEPPRPTFEHVWDVFVQRKGLGDSYGILGNYRLCITDKTLSLVRIGPPVTATGDSRVELVEYSLAAIRRCGASQRYFYLEVGRSTKTGAGEIWMEVQDSIIAHNMHTTIMKSAKNKDCDGLGPMRNRSSSANAASKPTQMLVRRQTHTGQKPINCSPSGGAAIARERCDSLPSRNRTSSETSTAAANAQPHQQAQMMLASGGMPPPRTIPSASAFHQRPHSMVMVQNRQSHSHSPPVHSSPLSPPSTGACSTGSDGSSLSIDETDSFVDPLTPDEGNGFPKVINPLSSGCSIPEENSDEYIHNYGRINQRLFSQQHRSIEEFGSHAVRRGSPAPPGGGGHHYLQHHHHQHHLQHQQQQHPHQQMAGSVESNYVDMCSPCGSSPGDQSGNGGYIPMSPVADYPRGLYTGSSSAHSRASSLAEDVPDGYVPMAPASSSSAHVVIASASASAATIEEYVDMEPSHNNSSSNSTSTTTRSMSTHVPTPGIPTPTAAGGGGNGNISSAASSCSITSGTPSTDMRFSAYHLEKVEARFTPSEDDEMDRPLRTYSVGSRLEHNKRKLRVDMLSSAEAGASSSRVRAFSVGSRAKVPRSELYKGSGGAPITAPLLSAGSSGSMQESNSNSGSITNTSTIGVGGMTGSGSSTSIGGSGKSTGKKSISAPVLASSKPHGSFDPMDDLMEIDFGAPFHGAEAESVGVSSSTPQKGLGMDDYMEMGAPGGGGIDTGYMEMKPGHLAPALEESDYLDMKPGCYEPNLSTKSTSSPITINSPKKFNGGGSGGGGGSNNNNYLEMSPRGGPSSSLSSSSKRKVPSDDYLNINPLMAGGGGTGGDSGNEDKMTHDEDELVAASSAPEGYMEMSWNQNKSSLVKTEGSKPASDEYINMDFTRKEVGTDSRLSSQPIAIQSAGPRSMVGDLMEPKMGGAPSNIPNYLPLNQIAAQQRHAGTAQIGFSPRSRCDSRDSGIVTPSGSQATIFPFSPGSPNKPFVQNVVDPVVVGLEDRKCLIDGTSGTLLITEMDETSEESNESRDVESRKLEDLSHNYAELSIGQQLQQQQQQLKTEKSRPSSFNCATKRTNLHCTLTTSTSTRTTATVTTIVGKSAVEYPDYVNCSPATTPVTPKPSTSMAVADDQSGDYAIMNPAASLRKLSSTSQSELVATASSASTSDVGLPPLLGKKSNTIGFRPITSSQDDALLRKASGVSPKPTFSRQFSERRATGTDSSGYELLQRSCSSRPNSVNSEKIGTGGGAGSGKCPPSAGSTRPNSANSDRLPIISATSSSASSTSTLCESKNQSPMASTSTLTSSVAVPEAAILNQPIVSRPPSVSSERELHYASLDLPPCGTNPPVSATAATTATRMEVDPEAPAPANSDSLNSSPSPNSGCTSQQPQQQTGAFTYAQIDFDRTGAPIPPAAASAGTAAKPSGGQP